MSTETAQAPVDTHIPVDTTKKPEVPAQTNGKKDEEPAKTAETGEKRKAEEAPAANEPEKKRKSVE